MKTVTVEEKPQQPAQSSQTPEIKEKPKTVAEQPHSPQDKVKKLGTMPQAPRTLTLTSYEKIEQRDVKWLWKDHLALGKLTILAGEVGVGKSYIAVDIAARVSTGVVWPDGTRNQFPGSVILFESEDEAHEDIRPRLDRQGADLTKIICPIVRHNNEEDFFTVAKSDLKILEQRMPRDTTLVIISPLNSYLPEKVNTDKDAAMRRILLPLKQFAERNGVALLAIMHLSKAGDRTALQRILGSVAYVGVARLVLGAVEDPENEGRRYFGGLKNNHGEKGLVRGYVIGDGGLRWESQTSSVKLDTLMQGSRSVSIGGPRPDKLGEATMFLHENLADVPEGVPIGDLKQLALMLGYSWRTVERAAYDVLRVRSITEHGITRWTLAR